MFDLDTIKRIREDFPILEEKHNDSQLVYFDNGATSQRPVQVVNAISEYYLKSNANVHRGIHFLADRADEIYINSRKKVQSFINAHDFREIIFTRNATESLNLVAYAYGRANLKKGDQVVLTQMEHHSNIVPWQILAEEMGVELKFIKVDDDGRLDMDDFEEMLSERVKIVSVSHVSNALGVVNPVKEIVDKAKAVGAVVVLDACQSVPHFKVDVRELGCDFLAFSAHKMCGPMGMGVLYGRQKLLKEMPPFFGGGSMIKSVSEEGFSVADLPEKFDAGTPNVSGAVGLAAAVAYLLELGLEEIEKYEMTLANKLVDGLNDLDFVKIIGPEDCDNRLAVASFVMDGVHAHDVAEFLNNEAICIRAGHHCAEPLMKRFGVSATARASLYFYNTVDEIDRFLNGLKKCYKFFS